MKTATLCVIMALQLTLCACADDTTPLTAVDEAGKDYLSKIEKAQEEIDKAQNDYLEVIRLALQKTTVIEVFLIDFPGKRDPDPFEDGKDPRFFEPYSKETFGILKSARIDKAKEVTTFLKATIQRRGGDILMFPYVPSMGFRCHTAESELFAATVDLKSQSMKVVFPDGQWVRMGIDVEFTRSILKSIGLH